MAEVLSPPMFPQNDPHAMLQQRPSSSSDNFPSAKSAQQHQTQHRVMNMPRSHFNSNPHGPGSMGATGYRGTSAGPVSPYAFRQTPNLRHEGRSASMSSSQPSGLDYDPSRVRQRPMPSSSASVSSFSTASSKPPVLAQPLFTKDDSELFSNFQVAPFTTTSGTTNNVKSPSDASSRASPSPDRYRSGGYRKPEPNGSMLANGVDKAAAPEAAGPQYQKMGQFYYNPTKPFAAARNGASPTNKGEQIRVDTTAVDARSPSLEPAILPETSEALAAQSPNSDLPKRYRKRASFGAAGSGMQSPGSSPDSSPPTTSHERRPSSASSAQRQTFAGANGEKPASPVRGPTATDSFRRTNNPSPLSRPLNTNDAPPTASHTANSSQTANVAASQSPAVAAMAALNMNDKDAAKGVKSRLRRAFSFGSSAELKRASEADDAADRAKARQEQFSSELDEEQEAIARQQEASGLGNSIYTGQGNVFTGSTDNLSISSTASSASLMLRKMGKGMKKGGKSIKGLFRPKSVIGVPAADGPVVPTVTQVSMVTVEAEREKVNVNVNAQDQPGGGTGFPRLERNSMDTSARPFAAQRDEDTNDTRRTMVGSEHDRAEVLAAVKRGILKRSTTDPSIASPPQDLGSPDRRGSPAPSTASSEPRRHKRTDSTTIESDDYFSAAARMNGAHSTRSLPGTPRTMARNISFSPRIQFHDVWSSTEYDRRGDIATCNRLTPMLAQQIKEELNSFKMEMEVHEQSKPHTHFF